MKTVGKHLFCWKRLCNPGLNLIFLGDPLLRLAAGPCVECESLRAGFRPQFGSVTMSVAELTAVPVSLFSGKMIQEPTLALGELVGAARFSSFKTTIV